MSVRTIPPIMQEANAALHRAFERLSDTGTKLAAEDSGVYQALVDVREAVTKIARTVEELCAVTEIGSAKEWEPTHAIEAINKLELHDGDILVLKLGDRNCGWIPSVDQEQRTIELFSDALAHAGLADKVTLLVCHYAHELEVVRDAASVRRHPPKDPELAATSKALGWEDD